MHSKVFHAENIGNVNPTWKIGIVYADYYMKEIMPLVEGAHAFLREAGIAEHAISLHPVPGSFEIPLLGEALAHAGVVDALMAFGIIVQGDTHHARLLADQSTRGLMDVQLKYRIPFAFEILYVHDVKQVIERSTGEGNKGREAANAVLRSLVQLGKIPTK